VHRADVTLTAREASSQPVAGPIKREDDIL
jgi:hypothetical protein